MENKSYRVTLSCQPITVDVEARDPDDAEYEAIQLLQNNPDIDITTFLGRKPTALTVG